jgi:quercetin 2,3-dioxygenase
MLVADPRAEEVMITVRKADDRGRANFGWLDSRHSFSFGSYRDPKRMGFGPLRVINDDRVAGGKGFDAHDHADMEIISYVLDGGLAHKDSLGNGSVIRSGDVQRMTAGTGITHAEFNESATDPVHFLQIWIIPERQGLAPGYEQRRFEDLDGGFRLIGSRDGREGSVVIHRDVDLYAARLVDGQSATRPLDPARKAWLQIARGSIVIGDTVLNEGDGVALVAETALTTTATSAAEVLLFDMA